MTDTDDIGATAARPELAHSRVPAKGKDSFDCPHCGTFAHQNWSGLARKWPGAAPGAGRTELLSAWTSSRCARCSNVAMWHLDNLAFPHVRVGPDASGDMPNNVLVLYNEAREVAAVSRQSAAALLRLALQHLVNELSPGGGTIDAKIGGLVQAGLSPRVQQAMDVVRVIGNNAVHPGQIDLDGDADLVPALLGLINMLVEQMITRPKELEVLYAALPAGALAGIERRDGTAAPS